MPIQKCKLPDGTQGYKYGSQGKCYKKKIDAIKQGIAIKGPKGFKKEMEKSKSDSWRANELTQAVSDNIMKVKV